MDEHDIEWTCGCGHTNPDFDSFCQGCGTYRYYEHKTLLEIIQINRANAGLAPLVQCEGGCGRMVEGPLCVTCDPEGRAKLAARREQVIKGAMP